MEINMQDQYRYNNGEKARILCVDRPLTIHTYPVISMNHNGNTHNHDEHGRSAAHSKWHLVKVEPYDDFEIDEPVMALLPYTDEKLRPRYFAGVTEAGEPTIWMWGRTSWSSGNGERIPCRQIQKVIEEK
jgi:hypothetical protein